MLAYFDMPFGWRELLKRTYKEMMADDALGLAAQLAYYFFLALFPAILCMIALASFFPLHRFTDEVIVTLGQFAPEHMVAIVREQMVRLADGNHGGVLSLGLLGAIWSSSAAMVAVIGAMNRAYDIEEGRPWRKVRIAAVLLTIGLAVFIVLSFGLIIAGPQLADWLAAQYGLGGAFAWTWKVLQWPIAFMLVVTGIGLIYYFAPDADQDWAWITPGSLAATTLWLAGSLAFRFYVVNFGDYEATYGAIAGVILLMLWFNLSGLVIILGAEMNAEIEHASEWGKAPAEKAPGERKKLGAAAARAWRERGGRPVSAPRVAVPPAWTTQPSLRERVNAYRVLLLRWRHRVRH